MFSKKREGKKEWIHPFGQKITNVNALRHVYTTTNKKKTSLQFKTSRTSDPTIHDLQQDPP